MGTEDEPTHSSRFRIVSPTFVAGFGIGTFVGVALALLAFLMTHEAKDQQASADLITPTQVLLIAGASVTPTPDPRIRTTSQQDVHLGPGEAFAIVGTLARGTAVEVVGRDAGSSWLAIRFPAGSAGRGWIPVSDVEGLTQVQSLAVAIPTPLSSAPSAIVVTPARQPVTGDDALSAPTTTTAAATSRPGSTSTAATSTPAPPSGPPDLVVIGLSLMSDGRVAVTVGNRGPGALSGQSVFVMVRDLATRSETLSTGVRTLGVGETVTLSTTTFRLNDEAEVQAIVDPYGAAPDANRGNNTISATLAPPATPRPTATPVVDTQ